MSDIQPNTPNDKRALTKSGVEQPAFDLSEALSELSAGPAVAAAPEGFGGFLHSIRRQWLPGLGLGLLVGSLVAALMWFVIPANFEAVALLQVGRSTSFKDVTNLSAQEFDTYKKNQQQLLRSRVVIESALRDPRIMQLPMVQTDRYGQKRDDPVDWLMGTLNVGYLGGDSAVLRVGLRGENPKHVQMIVDKVVDAYIHDIVMKESDDRKKEMEILDREIAKTQEDMDKVVTEMKSLQMTSATASSTVMNIKLQMFTDKLRELMGQQQETVRRRDMAEEEFSMAQMQFNNRGLKPPQWMVDDILKQSNPRFQMLAEQVEMLEQQVAQVEKQPGGGPSASEMLYNQLDERKFELDNLRRQLRPQAIERLEVMANPRPIEQDRVELAIRQDQLKMLDKKLSDLQKAYDTETAKLKDFEDGSIQLQSLMGKHERLNQSLSGLQQDRKGLSMRDQSFEQVKVVQQAMVPEVNNFWMKAVQVFGGGLFSMLGTMALVAYADFLGKRVNTRSEVAHIDRIPVLASLPQLTSVGSAALLPMGNSRRRALEMGLARSVDSLRAILARQAADRGQRSLLIASAGAQEGKTMLASQLAASFAKAGSKTLLIDADLHNPQLQSLVGVEPGPGLCEVLRGEIELDESIQALRVENLWFMQAGSRDASIDTLLNQPGADELFRRLRATYDFVVVDGGPVLGGPDSLLMAQHLDATLISVRRDVSRRDKVEDTCQRLKSIGSHIAGIIYCGGSVELRGSELSGRRAASPTRQLEAPTAS
ncbi:MAG: AAA family ATPase [Pirellulales bacterium]